MERKPLLRIAGPVWELARYFLVLALVAAGCSSSGRPDMVSAPWLAAAAGGGLVMPAAFLMLSLEPKQYAAYLPLLTLGKGLEIVTVLLLFVAGAVRTSTVLPLVAYQVPVLGSATVTFAIVAIADAVVLVGLFRVPKGRVAQRAR